MKVLLIAITAGALTIGSMGQDVTPGSGASNGSELNGTDLVAELSKSVNSKKAKLGDPVKATLTQDVIAHGKVVIRRGSKLVGHVTEAQPRSKEEQESRLGVVFDKAELKGGGEIDFSAVLRALAPPLRIGAVDKPDMMGPPMVAPVNQSGPQPMSNGPSSSGSNSLSKGAGNPAGNPGTTPNQAARAAQYSATTSAYSAQEGAMMGGGSRGVFGMPGIKLGPAAKGQAGSVVSSTSHDVKLDSGTQMVIQITNPVR